MKKLILLLCLTLTSQMHAYKIGDTLDPKIVEVLKLDPAKVTIVDFFASWCISCKKELPLINALHQQSDSAKVEILGVDTDKELEKAEAFQKEMGLKFRVYNDPSQEVIAAFDPIGMPACYIIKKGKVVDTILGAVSDIDKKLAQKLREY